MKSHVGKNLLNELDRLVEASEEGNFNIALDIDGLPAEDRKAARLFDRALKNYQAAKEYELMQYKLAGNALGIAHWDIDILDGDPANPNNRFTWSPELRRALGFPGDEGFSDIFAHWLEYLHPDDKNRILGDFIAHVADRMGKTPFHSMFRLRMRNGDYRYVQAFGSTLRDKTGTPLRVAGALEDITVQRQMQDELWETEDRIRIMLDASPFALTMWGRNFDVIDCSQSAVKTLGFSCKQELLDRVLSCAPEYQPNGLRSLDMLAAEMARAFETGENRLEWTHLTASGEPIIFDMSFVRVAYKGDYALMLYARDIRAAKKTLEELARRDEMLAVQAHWYKSLLDAIPLPISATDLDMNLTFVNAAAANLFGRNREEMIGLPCNAWNVSICGTAECSVARAKRGFKHAYFKLGDSSCMTDVEIIRDLAGEPSGFIEILHDITAVESDARRQANEANEAKSAFLATMSHEMRTPLNAVVGLSEVTIHEGGLSEEAESNLEKIYAAGSTLLNIVNDLLDLSKIESGKFEIIPNEYDVPSMINDAITQNILRIESKPIRFILNIDENMPARLCGDEIRVKRIMNNLLSNAFKYTEKGTVELALACAREDETAWVTIRVSDTGIGIHPEDHALLFSNYARLDSKANRKVNGTGLGLPITKTLVEMMEGEITVESSYGKGSVFTAKIRQQFIGGAVIDAELAKNLGQFHYFNRKRSRTALRNRIKLPYARVLVVDDHAVNLDVAKGIMKPYEMQIDCATGGREAVDAIRAETPRYNAVFMDHMMPGMDGMEATRLIREIGSEYARGIPIVALTANAIVGNEEMFLRNGFDAFISKPIDIMRLDEVIRRFVRNKDQEALLEQNRLKMRRNRERRTGVDRRSGGNRRSGWDRRDDYDGCAVRRRTEIGLRALCQTIDGLDISKGLKNFADEESFRQVLHSYVMNSKHILESIKTTDREKMSDYSIIIHGMKGSSRSIGAESVGRMADALERAAKSGDYDYVRDNNPAFLECAGKLVENIERALTDIAKNSDKPRKDKPDGTLLAKIRACCDAYDMDGVDAVISEMSAFEYESDPGFMDWLRENVNRLNFTEIKKKITSMQGTAL